jgi:hypothetical protein
MRAQARSMRAQADPCELRPDPCELRLQQPRLHDGSRRVMARSRACARITEDGRSPALPFTSTWALPWHSPLLAGNQL